MSAARRAPAWSLGVAATLALAAALWVGATGAAFPNYDVVWALVWGRDLAGGLAPDLARPFTPTPHPLGDALAVLAAPLSDRPGGDGALGVPAERLTSAAGPLLTAAVVVLAGALARAWFGWIAAVLCAVVVLTREPVLSYGLRAYLDLGYVALLLAALLAETHRPRNGWRTLTAITAAGLLRPEAWLLCGLYLLWLWRGGRRRGDEPEASTRAAAGAGGAGAMADARGVGRAGHPPEASPTRVRARSRSRSRSRAAGLLALAAVAPAGWLLEGIVLAGDPLHALTGTRSNAADLDRPTGLLDGLVLAPRRLGEIVREPVLLGALVGLAGTMLALPRTHRAHRAARLAVASGGAAVVAFLVLAAAGLPILTRYLLFPATIAIALAAAGLVGWRWAAPGSRARRLWAVGAALTAVGFVVLAPAQEDRLRSLRGSLLLQEQAIDGLRTLAAGPDSPLRRALAAGCAVATPNHRPVPQLVLWTGDRSRPTAPEDRRRIDAQDRPGTVDVAVRPTSERFARGFVLDRRDRVRALPPVPPGLRPTGVATESWTVAARPGRCARAVRGG